MPTFKGFNTVGQDKKFGLVDYDLVKRDLLNAFLIKSGELPGKPELGTTIWDTIFEPMDAITSAEIENEVRRIVRADARMTLSAVSITRTENIITVEMNVIVHPDENTETFYLQFDNDTTSASIS